MMRCWWKVEVQVQAQDAAAYSTAAMKVTAARKDAAKRLEKLAGGADQRPCDEHTVRGQGGCRGRAFEVDGARVGHRGVSDCDERRRASEAAWMRLRRVARCRG